MGVQLRAGERGITVVLHIPAEEYLQFYQGVTQVSARSIDGRQIVLPANALRRFVTHNGIHGTFYFRIDASGKLLDVSQLR